MSSRSCLNQIEVSCVTQEGALPSPWTQGLGLVLLSQELHGLCYLSWSSVLRGRAHQRDWPQLTGTPGSDPAHGKALSARALLPDIMDLTSFCHFFCHLLKLSGQGHISVCRPYLFWWAHFSFSSLLFLLLTGISALSAHSFSSLYCFTSQMIFFPPHIPVFPFTLLFLTYFLLKVLFSLYKM